MLSTRVKSKAAVRANLTLNMTNAKKAKLEELYHYEGVSTQVLECKDCQFKTKKTNYLGRHTKLMHGPNADVSNVLSCTSCEFETKKSKSLKDHINAAYKCT